MATLEHRSLLAVLGCAVLVTTGCTAPGADVDAEGPPGAEATSSPSTGATDAAASAAATIDGTFEFADGTTVGILGGAWRTKETVDGQFLHLLPGAPGSNFDDEPWGDLIVYVPDAAHASGTTEPEAVPADPVQWTVAHGDLEILDQQEISVDGVTATQIDARAVTPTDWLSFGDKDLEWGGVERVVLIPLDGSWLVVRGSVFDEEVALAETEGAFAQLVDSVRLPD